MSRNIFTQSSFLASSNESTKINSSFSFFKKKKKIQTRSTCKIKNLLGFANDTFWHVLSWITTYPRKKKKKHFEIAILFKFLLSHAHPTFYICVLHVYVYREDDILRICAHECISFHGNNRGFRAKVSDRFSFRQILTTVAMIIFYALHIYIFLSNENYRKKKKKVIAFATDNYYN